MKWSARALLFSSIIATAGCGVAVDSALTAAGQRAGSGIGSAVGASIGDAAGKAIAARMPALWTPDLTAVYVNYLFTMGFHSRSYTFEGTDYEVGEWTRWRIADPGTEGQPSEVERAFLHRGADGREWWRVK